MGPAGNSSTRHGPIPSADNAVLTPVVVDEPQPPITVPAGQQPGNSGAPTMSSSARQVVILRTLQSSAMITAVLAGVPLQLPRAGLLISVCVVIALFCTALLFVDAARRDRVRSGLGPAWSLFAVATAGLATTVLLRGMFAAHTLDGPTATTLALCFLIQLVAVWFLYRGRSPRWAPSPGWDGSVVALGATAIGIGTVELSARFGPAGTDPGPAELTWILAELALFVAVLTAPAIAAPTPRPQLLRLAGGLTAITLADLIGLTLNGLPALLGPMSEVPGASQREILVTRLLAALAVCGYAALGLGAAAGANRRRTDRRRQVDAGGTSLTGAVVAVCTVIVAAALIEPRAPRIGAALALGCVVVALARSRRALRRVQQAGRTDPRPRTDDLTGLANRRALSEALAGDRHPSHDPDDGWSGLAGRSDEIAMLLVDLDRFKDVNEGLGHQAGDRLLAEVGTRLRTALRPTQLLARLGGDEFAVVLPAAGADQARRVAEGLQHCLQEPFEIDGSRLHVRSSIGIATCHPSRGEPTDLLRQADVAMYHAKATGTGIEVYDAERDEGGTERLRRTDELREALQRGDLEVHVQPQVELRTGLIIGAEALVRWRHPEDGVLLPDAFLPLAERTGLMRPVAAVVLDRALEACASWWNAGHQVPVSVNLGADDLRDPELPGRVTAVLRRHALPADALRVEITEQTLLTDPAEAALVLARWRADGISVAIDDFGTGYSSLSYLRELPIDEVKLDRTFIADLRRPATTTIVRHTVAMAHGLWARVVAEGIEDEATARIATDLGCDVGQGLYFGAATTAPEFLLRLQAQPH